MKQLNARLNDEIRRRKTENRELNMSLGEKLLHLGSARCELIDITRQIKEVADINDKLRGDLGVTYDVALAIADRMGMKLDNNLPKEVQHLLDKLAMSDHEITKLGDIRTELLEEITELKQRCVEMEMTNTQLLQEIARVKEQHADVEAKWVAASSHNSQLADEALELRGELEGLQDVLSASCEASDSLNTENNQLRNDKNNLIDELAAAVRKADGYEQELDRLQGGMAGIMESLTAPPSPAAITHKPWLEPAALPAATPTHQAIAAACDQLREMLLAKNIAYGNSALEPVRIFSRCSPREQILVRIDDKLSRLAKGSDYPGDDTVMDLTGYLILLQVLNAQAQAVAA